jgi:hypothetical protein
MIRATITDMPMGDLKPEESFIHYVFIMGNRNGK